MMVLWIKTMRVLFTLCFLCNQISDSTLRSVWASCVRIYGWYPWSLEIFKFWFLWIFRLSIIPTKSPHRKRKIPLKVNYLQLNQSGSSVFRIIEVGFAWNGYSWLIYHVAFLSVTHQVRIFYNIKVFSLFTSYSSVLISRNLGDLEL